VTFLDPILAAPNARWVLRNARHHQILAHGIETAFDRQSRNRGLLGRLSLPEGRALILAPCNSIHTFFMKFPIDVAFVDRDGTIRRARSAVPPWRVQAAFRASAVVELASGSLQRAETRAGDRLYVAAE
jgi:uncharacterized membrane protein (UPF0127 family)